MVNKITLKPGRRSTCPIAAALDLIGDKWSLLIIRDIGLFDKHRNKDFQDADEGIPSNILSNRLRRLAAQGLIEKRPYQVHPPRYEYHLTEPGRALLPVVQAMARWATVHVAGVESPKQINL